MQAASNKNIIINKNNKKLKNNLPIEENSLGDLPPAINHLHHSMLSESWISFSGPNRSSSIISKLSDCPLLAEHSEWMMLPVARFPFCRSNFDLDKLASDAAKLFVLFCVSILIDYCNKWILLMQQIIIITLHLCFTHNYTSFPSVENSINFFLFFFLYYFSEIF